MKSLPTSNALPQPLVERIVDAATIGASAVVVEHPGKDPADPARPRQRPNALIHQLADNWSPTAVGAVDGEVRAGLAQVCPRSVPGI